MKTGVIKPDSNLVEQKATVRWQAICPICKEINEGFDDSADMVCKHFHDIKLEWEGSTAYFKEGE